MNLDTTTEIFRPSKKTWALVLLICVAFVAIDATTDSSRGSDRWFDLGGFLFFGVGTLVALVQFVPNSSFLQVGPDGLTIRIMWTNTFYRWSDIESFGVASTGVGLNFSATYAGGTRKIRNFLRRLTGFEGALPENYGRNCAELAAHLNRLRDQYVPSSTPTERPGAL